tara:strand:- start:197 stop:352 length:156 start_codon:yes stop_codon:yes gene_type:complete
MIWELGAHVKGARRISSSLGAGEIAAAHTRPKLYFYQASGIKPLFQSIGVG